MASDDPEDTVKFTFPPEANTIVGCGCVGAIVHSHTRIHIITGARTRTWRCGICGDARVARG